MWFFILICCDYFPVTDSSIESVCMCVLNLNRSSIFLIFGVKHMVLFAAGVDRRGLKSI